DRGVVLLWPAAGVLRRRRVGVIDRSDLDMAATSLPIELAASPTRRRVWTAVREVLARVGVTGLGLLVLLIFLLPLAYVLATAFKLDSQGTTPGAPLWPASPATYRYQDQDYPLYDVPGKGRLALVKPYREDSDMIDPAHPDLGA